MRINDYVMLTTNITEIPLNAVGLIRSIDVNKKRTEVLFIGIRQEITVSTDYITVLDVTRTGKGYKNKICNVCHIVKDYYKDFEINQTDAKGIKTTRPSCRDCRKGINGINLRNSERTRLDKIKPQYFFICPICEKASIPNVTANLVRDHDHATGTARDWLCDSCNTGLGRFKDDIGLLKKAIDYLKKHS